MPVDMCIRYVAHVAQGRSARTKLTFEARVSLIEIQSTITLARMPPVSKKRSVEDLQRALREEAAWKDSNIRSGAILAFSWQ